jgi:hypothetical protein
VRNYLRTLVPELFSEYTFGATLTTEVVAALGGAANLSAAPLVPHLQQEADLGFDLAVESEWALVFLQFKISQLMVGANAGQAADFGVPYLRFKVKTDRTSNGTCQHNVLRDLEGNLAGIGFVYYAAPIFVSTTDLNQYAADESITEHSVFPRPSQLPTVHHGSTHYYAYTDSDNVRAYSDPGPETASSFEVVLADISQQSGNTETLTSFLQRSATVLESYSEDGTRNASAGSRVAAASAGLGLQTIVIRKARTQEAAM